jgi:hypothetical protein
LTIEYLTGILENTSESSVYRSVVYEVDFMVKLLRACVWMPRRKKAKKDVVSCDKLREAANRL